MGNVTSQTEQATTIEGVLLGPPPVHWDPRTEYKFYNDITDPVDQRVEPVGRNYLAHARRKIHNRTFSEDEAFLVAQQEEAARAAAQREDEAGGGDDSFEIEPDHPDDLKRDVRDWKTQDHYRILGLGKFRWRATRAMIKKAHRTKVLVHHPDKKASDTTTTASATKDDRDDNYFKCIQRAYETLMDPVKRRQYDSIDSVPEDAYSPLKEGADLPFIEAWRPVFEREARFSMRDPKTIPSIGTMTSTREQVLAFYQFWFHFESWRSFEYLDKEEEDLSENRDEKRYMEKKNKAERAKRKREEAARLQKLVDTAYNLDPRLVAFKEQDRLAKEAKKQERQEVAKRARLEAEKEAALAKEQQEELEAQERLKREEERKEREAKKKAMRNKKKAIKAAIKDDNYFNDDGIHMPTEKLEIYLSELDSMLDKLSLESLEDLATKLQGGGEKSSTPKLTRQAKKTLVEEEAKRLVREGAADPMSLTQFGVEGVKPPSLSPSNPNNSSTITDSASSPTSSTSSWQEWSTDEVQLLIKAANKFPGGVQDRWNTIAGYIAYHSGLPQRSAEEVIKKSQQVQNKSSQAATVRQLQFQRKKAHIEIADAPSIRYDDDIVVAEKGDGGGASGVGKASTSAAKPRKKPVTADIATPKASDTPATIKSTTSKAAKPSGASPTSATSAGTITATTTAPAAAAWTAAEQKQLEAALKTYPPSWQGDGDRWDKIAEFVQSRTKKECKLRVKFLQEQVKAQKAAAAASKKA